MRIVHLEAGRHFYGGARQVGYLIDGLARLGVENVLICARGSAIAHCELPAEIVELPLAGDLDIGQTVKLERALRDFAPDVLHVHSRRGADLYGAWSARRARVPAVLTRRVTSAELRFWARLKFRGYRRIIAISTAVRDELERRFGVDPARIRLVASAVDTERFRPAGKATSIAVTLGLPAGAVVLASVAQLIARKGHDALLRAFAVLAARNPALYLICFGRGPLEAALTRRIESLGLTGRVRLAGFRDDLSELLPGCDLLVHPAEREGLGVAVLEAMAAGVPVVAARAGGISDVVEDGVTGLLVAGGDAAALAAGVERVLGDARLRAELVARARRKVENEFSIARMARATLEVYGEVTSGDGSDR